MDRYIPSTLSSAIASMLCKKWWQKLSLFCCESHFISSAVVPTIIATNQRCFWIMVAPVCAIGWEDLIPPQFWLNAVGILKHTHFAKNHKYHSKSLLFELWKFKRRQEPKKTKDDDDKRLCVCCVNVDPLKRTLIVCCPFSHDVL